MKIPNLEGKNIDTVYKIGNESGWYAFLTRGPNRQWQLEKITDSPNGYSGKYDEVLFVNKAKDRVQPYFFNVGGSYYFLKADPSVITAFPCPELRLRTGLCRSSFLYPKDTEVETDVSGGRYGTPIFSGSVVVTKMALRRPEIAQAINDVDLFAKLPK